MTGERMNKGFTLIELLVVVAILGFLAMSTVPVAEVAYIREKETEFLENMTEIRRAIKQWRGDCYRHVRRILGNTEIPDSLFCPPDIGSLTKSMPYTINWPGYPQVTFYPRPYLKEIPTDPFAGAPIWVQYYASGTSNASSVYRVGVIVTDASISTASGVFDVSCHYDPAVRRGNETAVDGSKYFDW